MSFYSSIAGNYDFIFPLNQMQKKFIVDKLKNNKSKILDVGCSTGSLACELAQLGHEVSAIDYDEEMIHKAKEKSEYFGLQSNPSFEVMDMRLIAKQFKSENLDMIYSTGNTLVHLLKIDEIEEFCRNVFSLLKTGGALVVQILNYDYILDEKITDLPLIENDKIKFTRTYHFREDGLLDFNTVIEIKEGEHVIKSTIPLLPLRKSEFESILRKIGFTDVKCFGNFKGDDLLKNSIPLVVTAEK